VRVADQRLIEIIDAGVAEAMRRGGERIACRRGCSHCCFGPFAITGLDAARLRVGLREAPQAGRILARAREAAEAFRPSIEAGDEWETALANLPCPVLDLETGVCELYPWRPIACRLHGPALRVEGVDLRHCRLNYSGATEEEIEAMRVRIVPAGAEVDAVVGFEAGGGRANRTYIAFALLGA
jgi:Fe-S-cluster containining protein